MKENNIYETHVFVCTSGKTCPHKGNVEEIVSLMRKEVFEKGLKGKIRINKSGCLDWCDVAPVMVVYPEQTWYVNLDEEKAKKILDGHILGGKPVEELVYKKEVENA